MAVPYPVNGSSSSSLAFSPNTSYLQVDGEGVDGELSAFGTHNSGIEYRIRNLKGLQRHCLAMRLCLYVYVCVYVFVDERENVQKKTFTKWVNSHLIRINCKVQDLYVDMRDGKMLIRLLEILSGERLVSSWRVPARLSPVSRVQEGLFE